MGGRTFSEMFKEESPNFIKGADTFEELLDHFRAWQKKSVVTQRQRWALEDEARKLKLKNIPKEDHIRIDIMDIL